MNIILTKEEFNNFINGIDEQLNNCISLADCVFVYDSDDHIFSIKNRETGELESFDKWDADKLLKGLE